MVRSTTVLLTLATLSTSAIAKAALPAFPGAEGFGKHATGGRASDTKVLFVTSLEDSGPGTLREALSASGPRIVLFKTGGVIELKTSIAITNDDITIAGQTAPGDGIIVKNYWIRVAANNVIVRGLRIRNGDAPGAAGDQRDSLALGANNSLPKKNIIIDRCSFGWSIDETMEFWFGVHDVTISNCILSEALWETIHPKGKHGYAMLIGNKENHRVSVFRNFFAHNERRNPWIKGNAKVEVVNNVVYSWGSEGIGLWGSEEKVPSFVNVIGNVLKPGPDSEYFLKRGMKGINLSKPAIDGSRFYLYDNLGPGRTDASQDQWNTVTLEKTDPKKFRADQLLTEASSGLPILPATQVFDSVLASAGAIPQDAADRRAIQNAREGSGHKIDSMAQLGGYPAYAAGTPPTDSDSDGLPDDWEKAHNLNPADPTDATKLAASGYLNVEEYANGIFTTESSNTK